MKCLELRLFPGAQVQLKSGGFPMTVEAIDGQDVTCVWADKSMIRKSILKDFMLKNSTAGSDMILIMEGVNASSFEIEQFKTTQETFGNA